jgi:Phytanoyl-CoA dioxygenase (PhyH)
MRKVFADPSLQAQFEKNGYIKIRILDEGKIKTLTQLYSDLTQDNTPNGFFSTVGENTTMKKDMHQHFANPFFHLWSSVFLDYKPVFSNFITKKSADSTMNYHQDWSFIEESSGKCSLNIWCPLVDTFHENGNLAVIPGSHYLKHQLRTSNFHYCPYRPYQDYFKGLAVELPTAAGEAIIYDNALIHGSAPNLGETNRLTASILAIPKEDSIVIHHISEDKKIVNLYKVKDDYLLNYNPFTDVPAAEFLYKQIPFVTSGDPLEELKQLDTRLQTAKANKPKTGFLKKLLAHFK